MSIRESVVIGAPPERVWAIVSDVDHDADYWSGLRSIKNTRREPNVVEREVTVGFIGATSAQKIVLRPARAVELTMTRGPLKGTREILLSPSGTDGRTKVEVNWDFEFSGVPAFARPFVKSQLEKGTREALARVSAAAERARGHAAFTPADRKELKK